MDFNWQEETKSMKEEGQNKHVIDMRETQLLNYSKRLGASLKAFQTVQCEYRVKEKQQIRETYLIACPDATEEQLKALDDPETAESVLESAFALGSNSAKAIISKAKDRKRKIDKIVQEIKRIVELIEQIDKLVEENSETIDKIVVKMESVEKDTKESVKELKEAREYQERANWLKRVVTVVVIVIILIVVFLLVRPLLENIGGSNGE